MTDDEARDIVDVQALCQLDGRISRALRHALQAMNDRASLCAAVEILSRRDTEGFMQDALDDARRHMEGK